jgi:hypothetical protein
MPDPTPPFRRRHRHRLRRIGRRGHATWSVRPNPSRRSRRRIPSRRMVWITLTILAVIAVLAVVAVHAFIRVVP